MWEELRINFKLMPAKNPIPKAVANGKSKLSGKPGPLTALAGAPYLYPVEGGCC